MSLIVLAVICVVVAAAAFALFCAVRAIAESDWFDLKRLLPRRPVPLSELIKGMKHDPDRWKEKV